MLLKQEARYPHQGPIFINNNSTGLIQNIVLSSHTTTNGKDSRTIAISFVNREETSSFYRNFTEFCPSVIVYSTFEEYTSQQQQLSDLSISKIHPDYVKDRYDNSKKFDVSFILSEQTEEDLKKFYDLLANDMSMEDLNIIKAYSQARSLSYLEQKFYEKLTNLQEDDLQKEFEQLFKDAKKIVEEERGRQVNVLWALADRYRSMEQKFIEILESIEEDDNYYFKAQQEIVELGFGWLTILTTDLPHKRQLLSKIMKSAFYVMSDDNSTEEEKLYTQQLITNAILLYLGLDNLNDERKAMEEHIDNFINKAKGKDNSIDAFVLLIDLIEQLSTSVNPREPAEQESRRKRPSLVP